MTSANPRIARLIEHAQTLPHGTRSRYNAGCRCAECKESNRVYERARMRRRIFHGPALVRADEVFRHIRHLSRAGLGRHAIAERAGVNRARIFEIANGERRWLKAETARRILAVTPADAKDGAYVPAGPTQSRIAYLVGEREYTRTQIARWLGCKTPALQIAKGDRVTKCNADRVEALYRLERAGRIERADDGTLREVRP